MLAAIGRFSSRLVVLRGDRGGELVVAQQARRVLDLASVLDTFVVYVTTEAAAAALVPADD